MNVAFKNTWIAVLDDPQELVDAKNLSGLVNIGRGKVFMKADTVTVVAVNDLVVFARPIPPMVFRLANKAYSIIKPTDVIGVVTLA